MPDLVPPTLAVRDSFLAGERAACAEDGTSPSWLEGVEADFAAYAARCRETRQMWGVPTSEYWFVSGPVYYGAVTIRHSLTAELRREGGHIGYIVVPPYRRRGHATTMLAGACGICRDMGMTELLLTCREDNTGSRRVIEANSGVLESVTGGVCRYWIGL